MEITAGILRGMTLLSPESSAPVRPTSVRARQAFFDSLGDLSGLVFADLCAGSGAMGLEAASRGASEICFAEKDPKSLHVIHRNIAKAEKRIPDIQYSIIEGTLPDSCKRLVRTTEPDIIFADPPYAESAKLLTALCSDADFTGWARGGKLFWEFPPDGCSPLKPPPSPWKISQIRTFGAVRFLILEVF